MSTETSTRLSTLLSKMVPVESPWKFVTSAGGTLTVSTPIARVGVNGTGGAIWVKRDSDRQPTRLHYGGIGGSLGLSLVPTPANFSFSIPQMPSAGVIYKLPFAGQTLSLHELKGALVCFEFGGDAGAGVSGSLMFLGGNSVISGLVGGATLGMGNLPALLATSNACVKFGGMTATVIPYNVSVSVYVGGIA